LIFFQVLKENKESLWILILIERSNRFAMLHSSQIGASYVASGGRGYGNGSNSVSPATILGYRFFGIV